MSKYIDAEKLNAGIRRRIKELDNDKYLSTHCKTSRIAELHYIDRFIDSLQQEQPEVDLEKEVDTTMKRYLYHITCREEQISFARHFYELGLKARSK